MRRKYTEFSSILKYYLCSMKITFEPVFQGTKPKDGMKKAESY